MSHQFISASRRHGGGLSVMWLPVTRVRGRRCKMSICHLHILLTNETAVDALEHFRNERLPHTPTSPSDERHTPVALCSGSKGLGRVQRRRVSTRGEPAPCRTLNACVGGGGAGSSPHWGKSKGKLDGTINYNI